MNDDDQAFLLKIYNVLISGRTDKAREMLEQLLELKKDLPDKLA